MIMMGPEGLRRLVDTHAAALVLLARQWCVSAEDVVQEAFIKFAAQRPIPTNPAGWLYRVVRNGAISAARAEKRREKHEKQASHQRSEWFLPCEGGEIDPHDAVAALERLPLDQREIVIAHLWGGLTFEQIGQLVGVSASTAHRRYLDGLRILRERLNLPCPKQI